MNREKSQSILDFVLVFIAIAGLAVGLCHIWVWFNANYAKRQIAYQQSRLYSGTAQSGYNQAKDIAATSSCPNCKYQPLDLTEDWVFKGKPSGKILGDSGDLPLFINPQELCQEKCLDKPGCKDKSKPEEEQKFNEQCDCYLKCMCESQISLIAHAWMEQAKNLRSQAGSLRENATNIRDAANKCKWYNPFCWFGEGKKTKKQLKRAARELDYQANSLDNQASELEQKAKALKACCELKTSEEQKICIKSVQGTYSCSDYVSELIKGLEEDKKYLNESKENKQKAIEGIDETIPACNTKAEAECHTECDTKCRSSANEKCTEYDANGKPVNVCTDKQWQAYYAECYKPCYEPCYETKRNKCCQETVYEADPWNRNCDSPKPSCEEENEKNENRCSLAVLKEYLNQEIKNIDTEIEKIKTRISELPACCEYKELLEQIECIKK